MKDKLLNFRMEHSISQRKMAEMCNISPTTIERIESGKEPSMIVRGKIEKVIANHRNEKEA